MDSQIRHFIDVAYLQESNSKPRLSAVYMKVSGDKLDISDTLEGSKYLSGIGEIVGEDWDWNYLKFHMNAGPIRIEDVNFVVPGKLFASKQIFLKATGIPIQKWEVEIEEFFKEKFHAASKAMNCPEK